MIQPQELRLGNLFLDAKGRLCKVEQISIDPYETKIRSIDHSITSMPIAAIPLTEEWLVKFGFDKKDGHIQRGKIMALPVEFRWFSNGPYLELGCNNGIYMGNRIKYVHQLQNLYFALTGQELEVKG